MIGSTLSRPITRLAARRRVLLSVGLVSFWAAFGVLGLANVWLLWIGDPLVHNYRTTLEYKSAIIGDAFLIPLVNMVIVYQFLEWKTKPSVENVVWSASTAAIFTFLVALFQAQTGLINWTMPSPYQWTWLGYYHATFMMAELTLLLAISSYFVSRHRAGLLSSASYRRLGFIITGLLTFALLLAQDYQALLPL